MKRLSRSAGCWYLGARRPPLSVQPVRPGPAAKFLSSWSCGPSECMAIPVPYITTELTSGVLWLVQHQASGTHVGLREALRNRMRAGRRPAPKDPLRSPAGPGPQFPVGSFTPPQREI